MIDLTSFKELHPRLSLPAIEDLKRAGLNQSEIARLYGVTRQAVSLWVRKYNGTQTARQLALQAWPWKVPTPQNQQTPYRSMRDHAEWWATGGEMNNSDGLARLRAFHRRLVHEVVEFDPELPPVDGLKYGGFRWLPRERGDAGLFFRVNVHTRLTDEAARIWSLRTIEPATPCSLPRGEVLRLRAEAGLD
ncbi:transcriptional repressor [Mycobacterium phage Aminay]|uniref:Helix-turn-helix DNA binding domain protein n=1 Tax=Mycobacterium phage Aminay TaxID=2250291 RepID=A0A345KV65_9CAUD|nr:transcriptional repressor [Mycobacterium phage Aminay]AXH46917.1 helix-turn-helix DNA binding domain protein [Mycobacterium phage Aminay]